MRSLLTILAAICLALQPSRLCAAPRQAFATPVFLLPYAQDATFIDYRPAINAAGTRIVFERQLKIPDKNIYSNIVDLYITDLDKPDPQRLVLKYRGSTRPDWCWPTDSSADGPIAFAAVAPLPDDDPSVFFPDKGIDYTTSLPPRSGGDYLHLPNTTAGMFYPTWFPGCTNLAVDVSGSIPYQGKTGPETKRYDLAGNMLGSLSGPKVWAGFPSVNPRFPRLLALAAQQLNPAGYNEDLNYVYLSNTVGQPPRVRPLDPRAPVNRYAARFEGRAPSFSPDGRWVAFESNRNCAFPVKGPNFAIFLQELGGEGPARQVTDCGYNAQHAKWYRQPVNRRTLLIVSVRMHPAYTGDDPLTFNARGIAALDITPFMRR